MTARENGSEQRTQKKMGGGRRRWHKHYAHVSKCKNGKIK
jgi:hypothetical protein